MQYERKRKSAPDSNGSTQSKEEYVLEVTAVIAQALLDGACIEATTLSSIQADLSVHYYDDREVSHYYLQCT